MSNLLCSVDRVTSGGLGPSGMLGGSLAPGLSLPGTCAISSSIVKERMIRSWSGYSSSMTKNGTKMMFSVHGAVKPY